MAVVLRNISSDRQANKQSQLVSLSLYIYIRMLSDYAKDECRDVFIGKEWKTML
jgi:hypothetical protein